MANYDLTWLNASNPSNFVSKRSLEKVEANLALMWQVKDNPQASADKNNTWSVPTGSRVLGTAYTNNTAFPMFVVVSLRLQSTPAVLNGGGAPSAVFEVKEGAGAFTTICNCAVSAIALLGAASNDVIPMMVIVNPGDQYRLTATVPTRSTVTIVQWHEWVFDAVHTPKVWTNTALNSSLTDPNKYADGCNALMDLLATTVTTSNVATVNAGGPYGTTAFVSQRGENAGVDATVSLKDSGGSYTVIGTARTNVANSLTALPFFVNHQGQWTGSGWTVGSASQTSAVEMPIRSAVVFSAGEQGATVDTKFKDFDQRASEGANVSKPWTRQSHGSGTSAFTRTTGFFFAVATVTCSPNSASAQGSMEGLLSTSVKEAGNALTPRTITKPIFMVQKANSNISHSTVTLATLANRYSWAMVN